MVRSILVAVALLFSVSLAAAELDATGVTLPVVHAGQKSVPEGGSGPREASFNMYLSSAASQTVTAEWAAVDYFTGAPHETGVVEFAPGETVKPIVVHYMADDLWGLSQRFRIRATSAVNATPGSEGWLVIVEDDPIPVMTIANATANEGAGNAVVTVSTSAPIRDIFNFRCETVDGTAVAPGDYTSKYVWVVLPAGDTSTTLEIPINDDSVIEGSESFLVLLHGGLNGPTPLEATVTILDDDDENPPSVTFEEVTTMEGDGPAEVPVKVTLSFPAPKAVTLEWRAYDMRTGETIDTGEQPFAIGETMRTLDLHFTGDELWGLDRQFGITVTKATNAVAAAEGRITVVDDELPPSIRANAAVAREGDGPVVITVVLSAPARDAIHGTYRTTAGTAVAALDFESRSGVLVIPAGSMTATITIPVIDDSASEGPESFAVEIETMEIAAAPFSASVTVLDDDARGRRRSARH